MTYDAATNTLYAGTGEANASADSEAGFGIYKSTDGGDTWTHLASNTSVASGSDRLQRYLRIRRRTDCPCVQRTRFRRTIDLVNRDRRRHDVCWIDARRARRERRSIRRCGHSRSRTSALRHLEVHRRRRNFHVVKPHDRLLEPDTHSWCGRHTGQLWFFPRGQPHRDRSQQLNYRIRGCISPDCRSPGEYGRRRLAFPRRRSNLDTDRAFPRVLTIPMTGPSSRWPRFLTARRECTLATGIPDRLRHASIAAMTSRQGRPVITDLTTLQNSNYCSGQCWYDNFVVSPAGYPDTVYLGGSYAYGEFGNVFRRSRRCSTQPTRVRPSAT